MEYHIFQNSVNSIVGDAHYDEYKHLLNTVHSALRKRCIDTLNLGYKIPETLNHLAIASKLPEKNYQRYIKYVYNNRHASAYTMA